MIEQACISCGEFSLHYGAPLSALGRDFVCDKCLRMTTEKKLTGGSSSYYELPEGAKELQDLIEAKHMNFAQGNIFKAAYRLGEKTGTTKKYDLEKIIWFATRELERIKDD